MRSSWNHRGAFSPISLIWSPMTGATVPTNRTKTLTTIVRTTTTAHRPRRAPRFMNHSTNGFEPDRQEQRHHQQDQDRGDRPELLGQEDRDDGAQRAVESDRERRVPDQAVRSTLVLGPVGGSGLSESRSVASSTRSADSATSRPTGPHGLAASTACSAALSAWSAASSACSAACSARCACGHRRLAGAGRAAPSRLLALVVAEPGDHVAQRVRAGRRSRRGARSIRSTSAVTAASSRSASDVAAGR